MGQPFNYDVSVNLHEGHTAIENLCSLGNDLHLLKLEGKISEPEYTRLQGKLEEIDYFVQNSWDQLLGKHKKAIKSTKKKPS